MLYQISGNNVVGVMNISNVEKEIEYEQNNPDYIRIEEPLAEFLECYEFTGTDIVLKSDWETVKASIEAELANATVNDTGLVVPNSITIRQAREQLIRDGLFSSVDTAIHSITDATERAITQNYWEYSEVFERRSPILIGLGTAIGLTEEQLDEMFIAASKL